MHVVLVKVTHHYDQPKQCNQTLLNYSALLSPLETQCMEHNYALICQEIKVGLRMRVNTWPYMVAKTASLNCCD